MTEPELFLTDNPAQEKRTVHGRGRGSAARLPLKILSDRRREGGGAYLARFLPPAGKVIKIVAVARSDERYHSRLNGIDDERNSSAFGPKPV